MFYAVPKSHHIDLSSLLLIYHILYWVRSTTGLLGFLFVCVLILWFVGLFANLRVSFCFVGGQR